jgi:hypothetical protein
MKISMKSFLPRLLFTFFLSSFLFNFAFASHNASRYFPFIERPEFYITKKKSYIYPALFITTASTAFNRDGGNAGIPELWGIYNLKSVIESVAAVKQAQGVSNYNPFAIEPGYSDWKTKDLRFFVDGKIKSRGLILNVEQDLFKTGFSAGFFLPIMHVNTSMKYMFDRENSDSDAQSATVSELEMLHRVRRRVHNDIGLKGCDWSKSGIGDLDVHLRWNHLFDHKLKVRSIDLNLLAGVTVPIGTRRDKDYPSSVPFMGNGHWSVYGDVVSEFELKQNWKLGMILGFMHQFEDTNLRRLSYQSEPTIFGALVGDVEVDPGMTIKVSPYFTLENVMDGLNFQFRYTYLRHNSDTWKDKRSNKTITSFIESDREGCGIIKNFRERLSSWRSHYLTLHMAYDSVEGMKNWLFEPKIYALFDYAFDGKGSCKTHQLTVGAELYIW